MGWFFFLLSSYPLPSTSHYLTIYLFYNFTCYYTSFQRRAFLITSYLAPLKFRYQLGNCIPMNSSLKQRFATWCVLLFLLPVYNCHIVVLGLIKDTISSYHTCFKLTTTPPVAAHDFLIAYGMVNKFWISWLVWAHVFKYLFRLKDLLLVSAGIYSTLILCFYRYPW